jgi:hypothetical protein
VPVVGTVTCGATPPVVAGGITGRAVGITIGAVVAAGTGVAVAVTPVTVIFLLAHPRFEGAVMHALLVMESPSLAPEVRTRDRSRTIWSPLLRVEVVLQVTVPEVSQPSILKWVSEMSEDESTLASLQSVSLGITSLTSIVGVQSLSPLLVTVMV